jgi:hypothetical protein
MKTKQTKPVNLVEGGKDEWEMTEAYRRNVTRIVRGVSDKYSVLLINEKRWIKRLLIKVRLEIEIERKIDALSSPRNLHGKDATGLMLTSSPDY